MAILFSYFGILSFIYQERSQLPQSPQKYQSHGFAIHIFFQPNITFLIPKMQKQ